MPLDFTGSAAWCAWAQGQLLDGRADRALDGFQRALAIDPSSIAAAFGLASVLLDQGDVGGAAKLVAGLAAADRDRADILWLQARLAANRRDAPATRAFVTRLLNDPYLDAQQRAEAWLLLGLALGDLQQTAAAFTAACEGKHILRDLHADQAANREGEVAKLRRIAAWLGDEATAAALIAPAAFSHAENKAATHVFLLGFPRSGTTLLEQVLAAHPGVTALEEAPTLAAAYQAFLSDPAACSALLRLGSDEAAAWVEHYWRGVAARGVDVRGRLFVDKQPAGTLYLPLILRLFPRAKILFALRDPRDVVLSCFRQAFQMNAMTYAFTDLTETALCYDACMVLAAQARARFPLAWMDVRHERLVQDLGGELARLTSFLGLAPDPAMLDFARVAGTRTIRTPSAAQVRAGLNRRGLGRWREFREELAPALPTLARWVERLQYPKT